MNNSTLSSRILFQRIVAGVNERRKVQAAGVVILILISAVAEILTLGSIIPFLVILISPEALVDSQYGELMGQVMTGFNVKSDVVFVATLFSVIILISTSIKALLVWVINKFSYGLAYDIGVQIYSKILGQQYSFYVETNSSQLVGIINKIDLLLSGVFQPLLHGFASLIIAAMIVTGFVVFETTIALSALCFFAAFYYLVSRTFRVVLRKNSTVIAQSQSEKVKELQESLGGIREIILDRCQDLYVSRFSSIEAKLRASQSDNATISAMPRVILEGFALLTIIGLSMVFSFREGGLLNSIPMLGALALGAQKLLPHIQSIYNGWAKVQGNKQVMYDVLDLLELEIDEVNANEEKANVLEYRKDLKLVDVFFSYNKSSRSVLNNVNLTLEAGKKIGFVGETGSGKSTLLDIVMGLLEPVSGQIMADGQTLDDLDKRKLQKIISHVPQTIYLSDSSIAENIAFGVPLDQINTSRLKFAAKCANIDAFIKQLPNGYSEIVGEQGVKLSGGQRQRIGIARALYKQAKILILDEATSALDEETEKIVMNNIQGIKDNVTVLIIAHRLTTLKSCDQIVEVANGRIRKIGSYNEVVLEGSRSNVIGM